MEHTFEREMGSVRQVTQRTSTVGFTATAIANAGTIGVYTASPVTFIASTVEDTNVLRIWNVTSCANSGARGDVAFDIMIGGAGSETPIITGLLFGGRPAYSSYTIPIYIPGGSRISGRCAAGATSRSLTWSIDTFQGSALDRGPSRWVSYGTNISSGVGAYGTIIAPGNATFSAWTSLTTNTTYAHDLWMPMTAVATGTTITALNYRSQFAIASTADAATMVTNGTGFFEGSWHTGNTTESWGQFATATNSVHMGLHDVIYAPRAAAASVSARTMASAAPDSNIASCAILAAVK